MPLVSIIISTYNSRRWLGEAVDSALAQTYPNCEVLVVDNGSTDGTGPWVTERYGTRVKYLRKEHGVLASGRNFGLRHAKGTYVQFLDADDLILPKKVAIHATYLDEHREVDIVYGHCLCFPDDEPKEPYDWPRQSRYQSGQIFSSMLYDGGYILMHMPLGRRTRLNEVGGFDESVKFCSEWDYWLRVAYAGATFYYLESPAMALYRVRRGSLSQSNVDYALSALSVLAKVTTYVQDPREQRGLRLHRAQGHCRFRYGKTLVEADQRCRGLREMARGVLADRRDLDYKLGFMLLCMLIGSQQASDVLRRLKNVKGYVLGRQTSSDG
ncbi:glycosyltransferase [Acidobacteria bacterium AH-259-D05]|nr:glycosyltransferase [Acidobacteria bacterium AH-259-D05]